MVDSDEQLYQNFIKQVQRNLHVVFTMNPSNPDFSNRTASSPALFNRCVIDWFGDWSKQALFQVGKEFTRYIVPAEESFENPKLKNASEEERHLELVKTVVHVHNTVKELNSQLAKSAKKFNYITPRDFLDFIHHFVELYREKSEKLSEEQLHLNSGLQKLKETEEDVRKLQTSLDGQNVELQAMDKAAKEKMQ